MTPVWQQVADFPLHNISQEGVSFAPLKEGMISKFLCTAGALVTPEYVGTKRSKKSDKDHST